MLGAGPPPSWPPDGPTSGNVGSFLGVSELCFCCSYFLLPYLSHTLRKPSFPVSSPGQQVTASCAGLGLQPLVGYQNWLRSLPPYPLDAHSVPQWGHHQIRRVADVSARSKFENLGSAVTVSTARGKQIFVHLTKEQEKVKLNLDVYGSYLIFPKR